MEVFEWRLTTTTTMKKISGTVVGWGPKSKSINNKYIFLSIIWHHTNSSFYFSLFFFDSLFDSLLLSPTTSNRAWLQASDHRNLTHWTTLDSKQLNNIYFKIFYVIYKFGFARFSSSSSNITKTQISSNYTAENY